MNGLETEDGQALGYVRRRFVPCPCDAVRGDYDMAGCPCSTHEDGTASHGGTEAERSELFGRGFPRKAHRCS